MVLIKQSTLKPATMVEYIIDRSFLDADREVGIQLDDEEDYVACFQIQPLGNETYGFASFLKQPDGSEITDEDATGEVNSEELRASIAWRLEQLGIS